MTSANVRTRFAPSPTGYMHIGNLRTALYTFLFARHQGGAFILRIEDTDQSRYVSDAVDIIYQSLKVTGLNWDEGPDLGGPVGPYVQSERKAIYRKYAEELMHTGNAYPCFCTKESLDEIRKHAGPQEAHLGSSAGSHVEEESEGSENETSVRHSASPIIAYDGRCSRLARAEVEAKLAAGTPYVIRQKINRTGATTFQDLVFGEITINNEQLDDQVLIKADGLPTYNFANVVDDHLMGITHVMRGSEYISSTPKYVQLYRAFGWTSPATIHLPLINGPSGKKLSKREGSVALSDFLNKGYLPEAILNYIALLGWSPGDDTEFFTLEELIRRFDVARINKSPAIFDETKLKFINSLHIKAKTPEQFHALALPYYPREIVARLDVVKLSALIQSRTERLSDIPEMLGFLLEMPFPYEKSLYEHKKMKTTPEASLPVLKEIREKLATLPHWDSASLHQLMIDFAVQKGLKNGQVMWPVRVALTGLPSTPGGATEVAELLGPEETLRRLDQSIALLS